MNFRWFLKSTFVGLALSSTIVVPSAYAQKGIAQGLSSANPRVGVQPTRIASGFQLQEVAQGSEPLENPSTKIKKFGFLADGTNTVPDENTYVVFDQNPGGPDSSFDYGRHFLYQGHENSGNMAYVTRINLDITEAAHRITLLTPEGASGFTGFNSIDGSTWNPFTRTFFFTQEAGSNGGVIQLTAGWPAVATTLDGIVGKAGYEGVHLDNDGNLYLVEDSGGTSVNIIPGDTTSAKTAKQPNSFVYRFVPYDIADFSKGGKLQSLQVSIGGNALVFTADAVADTFSTRQLQLHTPGSSWPVRWITVHDTAVDGTASFNANAAAKKAGATPFKRPENMAFLPGSGFNTFVFVATGDTDIFAGSQPALQARGSYGSLFRVDFHGANEAGTISLLYLGDSVHNSFDNLTFIDNFTVVATEDRGDSLHGQLNTLDSIWAFDVRKPGTPPQRFVALGRDPESLADAQATGDGDNEPTGLIVSDGSPTVGGLLYKQVKPNASRWFFTQQHGENVVWEIVPAN